MDIRCTLPQCNTVLDPSLLQYCSKCGHGTSIAGFVALGRRPVAATKLGQVFRAVRFPQTDNREYLMLVFPRFFAGFTDPKNLLVHQGEIKQELNHRKSETQLSYLIIFKNAVQGSDTKAYAQLLGDLNEKLRNGPKRQNPSPEGAYPLKSMALAVSTAPEGQKPTINFTKDQAIASKPLLIGIGIGVILTAGLGIWVAPRLFQDNNASATPAVTPQINKVPVPQVPKPAPQQINAQVDVVQTKSTPPRVAQPTPVKVPPKPPKPVVKQPIPKPVVASVPDPVSSVDLTEAKLNGVIPTVKVEGNYAQSGSLQIRMCVTAQGEAAASCSGIANTPDGTVNLAIVRSSGLSTVDEAAKKAALDLRFTPAEANGIPVASAHTATILYQMIPARGQVWSSVRTSAEPGTELQSGVYFVANVNGFNVNTDDLKRAIGELPLLENQKQFPDYNKLTQLISKMPPKVRNQARRVIDETKRGQFKGIPNDVRVVLIRYLRFKTYGKIKV